MGKRKNVGSALRAGGTLTLGFLGGLVSPHVARFFGVAGNLSADQAISIANTYIIYTTLIFVGFTVILGIAGYIFAQEFSDNKKHHLNNLIEEFSDKIRDDEDTGVKFIEAAFNNPDVRRHVIARLDQKIEEFLSEKKSENDLDLDEAKKRQAALARISDNIRPH
jgi:hypothetical protein